MKPAPLSPARAASIAALSASTDVFSAIVSISSRIPEISSTCLASAIVRSLEAWMPDSASRSASWVSMHRWATPSACSAIADEVRESSSIVAEVSVLAALCSLVAEESCSAAADSSAAEVVISVPAARRVSTRLSMLETIVLKDSPRRRLSFAPAGCTRAVRSPAATAAAACWRAISGRLSNPATINDRPSAASRPRMMSSTARRCWRDTAASATEVFCLTTTAQCRVGTGA